MLIQDFFGDELQIGDHVAFSHRAQTSLAMGIIVKITTNEKGRNSITIETNGLFNKPEIIRRVQHNVIKVEKDVVIEKILCKK